MSHFEKYYDIKSLNTNTSSAWISLQSTHSNIIRRIRYASNSRQGKKQEPRNFLFDFKKNVSNLIRTNWMSSWWKKMASFTAQAALRSKWSTLIEEHPLEVPAEVSSKVTSVVGWLKQVSLLLYISSNYWNVLSIYLNLEI